jgi:hypothetical protein
MNSCTGSGLRTSYTHCVKTASPLRHSDSSVGRCVIGIDGERWIIGVGIGGCGCASGRGSAVSVGSSGWESAVGGAHRGGNRRWALDHRGGDRRLWLCIGVGRGGWRWIIGVRRDASRTTTRRPRVDTRGSGCTVDLERWWGCGAALRGLTPHAALSMLWSFAALRRAKHHGASFLHNVCWHHNMLSAARGVSPFKRPAAPLCSLLTVRSEPQVSTWGRRVVVRDASLPTPMIQRPPPLPTPMIQRQPPIRAPMHNHNRRSAPRCTTTTAYPRPDAQPQPPIPTSMIQHQPPLPTPMIQRQPPLLTIVDSRPVAQLTAAPHLYGPLHLARIAS